mgnify:FL=1
MRLNKYIAESGITSRRKADELIKNGEIKINGETVTELGTDVNESDTVEYMGSIISVQEKKIYIMLNKPAKYLSSVSDDRNRKTVVDLIRDNYSMRLYPIGRLDYDTEGLILMTNDGEITKKLTHPSHNIKKTYFVRTDRPFTREQIQNIVNGVDIGGYVTRKCEIKLKKGSDNECYITIGEGKNRQVRKMFSSQNLEVTYLRRISIGDLTLGNLGSGKTRELTDEEIKYLKSIN